MENLWDRKRTAEYFGVKEWTIDSWCRRGILPFEAWPCGKRFDPAKIRAIGATRAYGPSIHGTQDIRGAA